MEVLYHRNLDTIVYINTYLRVVGKFHRGANMRGVCLLIDEENNFNLRFMKQINYIYYLQRKTCLFHIILEFTGKLIINVRSFFLNLHVHALNWG